MLEVETTKVEGVLLLQSKPIEDQRGHFLRFWDKELIDDADDNIEWAQGNAGFNLRAGTLRGLHFQQPPESEWKLIWCGQGRLFDVVADLRSDSPTQFQWVGVTLEAGMGAVLVPPGCAHGYQTLSDSTELRYLTDRRYQPALASGVRWNDPTLGIEWPRPPTLISEQDQGWRLISGQEE
jgi:dTDP-4-dehydrorhamnose 3,5-epimerase